MVVTETVLKRIDIRSDIADIYKVREAVLAEMLASGYTGDARMSVAVAIDEVLANAICHGNRNKPDLMVEVGYSVGPEEVNIKVKDQGRGFDWRKNRRLSGEDDFTGYEISGRGLFLIHEVMSSVEFNDAGNEVTLTKCRQEAA